MFIEHIQKRIFTFWGLQFLGWGLMLFVDLSFYALGSHLEPQIFIARTLILNSSGFLLSSLLRHVYRWFQRKTLSLWATFILVICSSFVVANLWLALGWSLYMVFKLVIEPVGLSVIAWNIYSLSTFILAWSALYFGIKYWQESQIQKERALKATALAHKAQLQMLRYQLNPHFLFNALNSIGALIAENQEQARQMISELSNFLRYTLVHDNRSHVTLDEEIQAIYNYLAIEKRRFEDDLEIKIDIDEKAGHFSVPGFLLHPLVENAVKYGLKTSPKPLQIHITAKMQDGALLLDIANSGHWVSKEDENGTGTGLRNVEHRLKEEYPRRHKFETFQQDGRVHARIFIRPDKGSEHAS